MHWKACKMVEGTDVAAAGWGKAWCMTEEEEKEEIRGQISHE